MFLFKGFAYIAILMLLLLIGFIVMMDVLKYVFGIDPVQADRDALEKKKMNKKKVQQLKIAYRYQYIN
jgi:hypothetical protein